MQFRSVIHFNVLFFFFSQKMVVQLNRRLSVEQNNKCIQLFIRNRKDTSLIAYVNIVSATTFFVHNGVSQIIMIQEMRKSLWPVRCESFLFWWTSIQHECPFPGSLKFSQVLRRKLYFHSYRCVHVLWFLSP